MAILARNHRWFVIANFGASRVGARIILLNTEFSGPQIRDVSEREGAKVIVYDDEYSEAVKLAEPALGKLRALSANPDKPDVPGGTDETLAELIARSSEPAPKVTKHSSVIILTSGTTGTPKGANRKTPPTLAPVGGILSHVPFRSGEVTALPSPMFHALGYLHATIASHPRFDIGAAPPLQAGDCAGRCCALPCYGHRCSTRDVVPDARCA